jgi:hypothetical protein
VVEGFDDSMHRQLWSAIRRECKQIKGVSAGQQVQRAQINCFIRFCRYYGGFMLQVYV